MTHTDQKVVNAKSVETHVVRARVLLSSILGDEKRFGVLQFLSDPSKFADCATIRSADPVLRNL